LHLAPCSRIVQLAQKYDCALQIRKGDRQVDGTSMLDLLTLAAERGAVLQLETRGERAEEAMEAIAQLFERDFEVDASP
jgi:phosphocarrier protein